MQQTIFSMRFLQSLLLVLASVCLVGSTTPPAQLHTFTLHGDVQAFSLRIIDAFPFIEGEIDGQKGKLMFDTGNSLTLAPNNHLLKLPPGQPVGQGATGSGQQFTRTLHDTIASLKLSNGLAYQNLLKIQSIPFDFLEQITPDCIGQIGSGYVEGYILKLDYAQRRLTCYQQTAARRASRDYLQGEQVVAVLDIETRKRRGNVVAKVRVGGIPFLCLFDTAQQGGIVLDLATRRALLAKRALVPLPVHEGDSLGTLRALELAPGFQVDAHAINLESKRNKSMDAVLGLTSEPHVMSLGYAFLSQFTTIWDSQAGKMYVCAPR